MYICRKRPDSNELKRSRSTKLAFSTNISSRGAGVPMLVKAEASYIS